MAPIGKDIEKVVELLNQGKPVAIPTETVYGLAANALDPVAAARIFEVKKRPFFDPLIVHTYSAKEAEKFVIEFPEKLKQLAQTYWPGPLTLLLKKSQIIPELITSGSERVAIRVPDHALTLELLKLLDFPLAAPSANPFGYISPTSAEHVNRQLGSDIEYILDGGNCEVGLESTIVGSEDGKICVYRLGGLSVADVESVVGKVELRINQSSNPSAPGQLKSHYAPRKPLFIGNIKTLIDSYADKRIAVLAFGEVNADLKKYKILNLSQASDLREAAANLFGMLRELDDSEAEVILTSYLPNKGLGLAINDRLQRAAVRD